MTRRESACVVESPGSVTPAPPAWPIRLPDLKVCESAVQVSVLRSWRAGAAQCDALSRAFALPWPVQPNTVAGDVPRVLWLAPSEWAILDAPAAVVAARVAQACGAGLWHCADLTESRVAFELRGARAGELLAKGCSLDLHPRAFAPGACAQTLLAQVPIWIEPRRAPGGAAAWLVHADTSVAAWLRAWLADAALEYT
jgi:sarcosine oxidase subunit gamma